MADSPIQDRDLGLRRTKSGGRFVTKYDPHIGLRICEQVAEGETLKQICKSGDGFPARQTFHRWVVGQPELAKAYAAAKELSSHSLEEEALDIARDLKNNSKNLTSQQVRAFDVAMTQLRWSARVRNPKVYSDKANLTFTVPIQINTTIDLGDGLETATDEHPNIYEISATVVQEHPEGEKKEVIKLDGEGGPLEKPGRSGPKVKSKRLPKGDPRIGK